MRIIAPDGGLTDAAYTALRNLVNLPPKELRNQIYGHVPENLVQLQKWKRGELVAALFDVWAKKNGHRLQEPL